MSSSSVFHFSRFIPRTLAIVATFVGTPAAQAAQAGLNPCQLRDLLVSHPSMAEVQSEDSVSGADGAEELADAAQRLLGDVHETHYQHKTHIDRAAGAYDLDCSGFVDYLLKQVAPERFSQIPVEPGHVRPRAAVYFQFLNRLREQPVPGWQAVHQLGDARRGDIIAWALQASTRESGDTGHVVIVAATPVLKSGDSYGVEVYDSSGIRHDDDSRTGRTGGVGSGVITFRINRSGEPIAFQFNSRADIHSEAIAIGRLVRE